MIKKIKLLLNKKIELVLEGKYDVIFSVFSLFSVFLLKGNPDLVYPQFYYFLILFLFINLLFNIKFNNKNEINYLVLLFFTSLNILLIAFLMFYSGQKDSYLWFLLLLPILNIASTANNFQFYFSLIEILFVLIVFYSSYFKDKDIDTFSFIVKASIIYVSTAFLKDIAKSKKNIEKELNVKKEKAEELIKKDLLVDKEIRGDFFLTAIHDLKNLMTIISVLSQILEEDNISQKEEISKISTTSKMATKLAIYVMNVNKKERKLEKLEIKSLINECIDIADYKIYSLEIKIIKKFIEKNIFIYIDKIDFQRVILNLLLNSFLNIKPKIGEIEIEIKEENEKCLIIFSDNGNGFPKEIIDGVAPYKSTRTKSGGTGLGLYSSIEIIKKFSGEVNLYNKENNQGAIIEIILPLSQS